MDKCRVQNKNCFLSWSAANRVLRKLQRKSHSKQGSVYRCNFCHAWHVTHWDYENQDAIQHIIPDRHLSKKQLRSRRTKLMHEVNRGYDELYNQYNETTMMKITPIIPNCDRGKLCRQVSAGLGELKLFVGGTINCAWVVAFEAITQLRQCKTCRHEAKRLLTRALDEWHRYERELQHPTSTGLRFFSLQDVDPEYRKRYGNITDAEYFEFWQGTGGEMYAKCLPHISSYIYKLERYCQRAGAPYPHAYALAMAADTLLELSTSTYQAVADNIQSQIPPLSPSFVELTSVLNPVRVLKTFRQCIKHMFLDSLPELTDEEVRNFSLSVREISNIWSDPVAYCDIQGANIESYGDEVFRTKGEVKKILRLNSEKRAEMAAVVLEQRRKEMLEKQ